MNTQEILEVLKNCNFNQLTEENYEYQIIDKLPFEIDYNCGVTKAVLFFPNTDFVIKIPFAGCEEEEEEYSEEDDEFYGTGDYYFSSFQFAEDEELGDDYCKAELIKYTHITQKYSNLMKLFAPTSFIGYVNDYPIYMQPICEVYNHSYNTSARRTALKEEAEFQTTILTCKKNQLTCFNPYWLTDVLKSYGQETLTDLCQCLKEEHIRDLHNDNIGYYNGKPIIFDYASFFD